MVGLVVIPLLISTGLSVLTSWPTDNVHPTASVCNLPAQLPAPVPPAPIAEPEFALWLLWSNWRSVKVRTDVIIEVEQLCGYLLTPSSLLGLQ